MQIRIATELDTPQIAQLHASSWQIAYRGVLSDAYLDRDVVRDRLTLWQHRLSQPTPNQYVLVAVHEGELVAFVCLYGAYDPKWGTLVDNLHVCYSSQRQGIGALLMKEAAIWCCQTHPHQGVYLWVLQPNLPAQEFYNHLGASNAESDVWASPDGREVPMFRFMWPHPKALANRMANIIPENKPRH
jgi:GNAT superfamily N-acetyltransferase